MSIKVERILFCDLCQKSSSIGFNRPKSLHRTKKLIKPNLQKRGQLYICNRCRRTLKKLSKTR